MDVDARAPDDACGPVMMQQQAVGDANVASSPDPWSSWAKVVDLAAPVEFGAEEATGGEADAVPQATPPPVSPSPTADGTDLAELVAAVTRLTAELADERARRGAAEDARLAAATEVARLEAEVAAARTRIPELERDRDEVIHRAEELLTAVRERADQRLAEERRRADLLLSRLQDVWMASAILRRARPLRLRDDEPATPEEAEQEVVDALDEYETDPAFAAESPELAHEIDKLRERLRAQLHKPPNIPTVEDGVDRLRESRLQRDAEAERRRR